MNKRMHKSRREAPRRNNEIIMLGPVVAVRSPGVAVFCAVVLLATLSSVESLAPPHPDWSEFESVHAERRRLNITYNYTPQHVTAEHCRYLSEETCRMEDELTGTVRQQLVEKVERRRRLQVGAPIEFPGNSNKDILHSPNFGDNFKIPVFLIRFPEDGNKPLQPREYFDEMFNGKGTSDINPAGSIAEWLYYNSLGQYKVTFDVYDWVTAPNTAKFYAKGNACKLGILIAQEVFRFKLDAMDAASFNFDQYDQDKDFRIDHLVALHSGFAAEFGDLDCAQDGWRDRVWSQAAVGGVADGFQSRNAVAYGYTLSSFVLASAIGTKKLCDSPGGDMGIPSHEFMHGFALPDLYDTDPDIDTPMPVKIGGPGSFDVMANAFGFNRDAKHPGMLSSFSRQYAGWLTPINITRNGFYAVQPAEVSGTAYRIDAGFPEGEYLLIENRQGILWDGDWPAKGLVILHIDEKAPMQTQRGYPGHSNWPSQHYRVAALQADGLYNIEKGENVGDAGDLWTKDMVLGPGPDTWPNTDSYQGQQYQTGIKITVMSDPGFIMIMKVEGLSGTAAAPGFAPVDPSDSLQPGQAGQYDPTQGVMNSYQGAADEENTKNTGNVIAWILSLLGGIAMVTGLLVVLL